jgi:GNAT superfamily N-acetyltransferase
VITFQVEKWAEFEKEGSLIFRRHWEDLALDHDKIDLGVDNQKYQQMDDLGILHILTARKDGRLIGYFLAFLMVHPHYSNAGLMAIADVYYLLPEARSGGTGARLFAEVEKTLKARGVVKAYLSCKLHQDHSKLFTRLGWKPTDLTFTKYLGQ